jgi:ABC-2 type transport system permease protein
MSMMNGTTCITNNGNLIKKVYFPREILPISSITSGAVNFLISCIIILLFAFFTGSGITWHIVFLPLVLVVQYIFSLSLVLLTSAINVYVKDVEYMINFIINLLFYATPILYPSTMFADTKFIFIFKLNPFAYLVEAYRNIFYVHTIPGIKQLLGLLVIGLLLLIICYAIFKKLEKRFAEEI